jgi:pilus assembly protein CpaB
VTAKRRRGALMLSLSLACGGLAASEVQSRSAAARQQVGAPVTVVTVTKRVGPGTKLTGKLLGIRSVPARFAPPDALTDARTAIGLRTAGALEPGAYVTAGALDTGGADPEDQAARSGPGRGERAVELKVAAVQGIAPGARVDVVVSTQKRTTLALEDVELLALRDGGGQGDPGQEDQTTIATLRVTVKEAVYLTAAHNFAREVRLLPRSPGDTRRAGALEFDGGSL